MSLNTTSRVEARMIAHVSSDIPWCAAVERLSDGVERMIQIQMTAYPSAWSEADKREMAERELFGDSKEQEK